MIIPQNSLVRSTLLTQNASQTALPLPTPPPTAGTATTVQPPVLGALRANDASNVTTQGALRAEAPGITQESDQDKLTEITDVLSHVNATAHIDITNLHPGTHRGGWRTARIFTNAGKIPLPTKLYAKIDPKTKMGLNFNVKEGKIEPGAFFAAQLAGIEIAFSPGIHAVPGDILPLKVHSVFVQADPKNQDHGRMIARVSWKNGPPVIEVDVTSLLLGDAFENSGIPLDLKTLYQDMQTKKQALLRHQSKFFTPPKDLNPCSIEDTGHQFTIDLEQASLTQDTTIQLDKDVRLSLKAGSGLAIKANNKGLEINTQAYIEKAQLKTEQGTLSVQSLKADTHIYVALDHSTCSVSQISADIKNLELSADTQINLHTQAGDDIRIHQASEIKLGNSSQIRFVKTWSPSETKQAIDLASQYTEGKMPFQLGQVLGSSRIKNDTKDTHQAGHLYVHIEGLKQASIHTSVQIKPTQAPLVQGIINADVQDLELSFTDESGPLLRTGIKNVTLKIPQLVIGESSKRYMSLRDIHMEIKNNNAKDSLLFQNETLTLNGDIKLTGSIHQANFNIPPFDLNAESQFHITTQALAIHQKNGVLMPGPSRIKIDGTTSNTKVTLTHSADPQKPLLSLKPNSRFSLQGALTFSDKNWAITDAEADFKLNAKSTIDPNRLPKTKSLPVTLSPLDTNTNASAKISGIRVIVPIQNPQQASIDILGYQLNSTITNTKPIRVAPKKRDASYLQDASRHFSHTATQIKEQIAKATSQPFSIPTTAIQNLIRSNLSDPNQIGTLLAQTSSAKANITFPIGPKDPKTKIAPSAVIEANIKNHAISWPVKIKFKPALLGGILTDFIFSTNSTGLCSIRLNTSLSIPIEQKLQLNLNNEDDILALRQKINGPLPIGLNLGINDSILRLLSRFLCQAAKQTKNQALALNQFFNIIAILVANNGLIVQAKSADNSIDTLTLLLNSGVLISLAQVHVVGQQQVPQEFIKKLMPEQSSIKADMFTDLYIKNIHIQSQNQTPNIDIEDIVFMPTYQKGDQNYGNYITLQTGTENNPIWVPISGHIPGVHIGIQNGAINTRMEPSEILTTVGYNRYLKNKPYVNTVALKNVDVGPVTTHFSPVSSVTQLKSQVTVNCDSNACQINPSELSIHTQTLTPVSALVESSATIGKGIKIEASVAIKSKTAATQLSIAQGESKSPLDIFATSEGTAQIKTFKIQSAPSSPVHFAFNLAPKSANQSGIKATYQNNSLNINASSDISLKGHISAGRDFDVQLGVLQSDTLFTMQGDAINTVGSTRSKIQTGHIRLPKEALPEPFQFLADTPIRFLQTKDSNIVWSLSASDKKGPHIQASLESDVEITIHGQRLCARLTIKDLSINAQGVLEIPTGKMKLTLSSKKNK